MDKLKPWNTGDLDSEESEKIPTGRVNKAGWPSVVHGLPPAHEMASYTRSLRGRMHGTTPRGGILTFTDTLARAAVEKTMPAYAILF